MKKTILVVDDEQDALDLLVFNLEKAGFAVLTARTGIEAAEQAVRHRPALVILDVILPEIHGLSVCEHLRRDPATASTPIILLSGWDSDDARRIGESAGANDYMVKPFNLQDLLQRIHDLLPFETAGTVS